MENSEDDISHLLEIIAAHNALHGHDDIPPFFDNASDFLNTVDSSPYGDLPWYSFAVQYAGPVDENSPAWKQTKYVVHARNTLHAAEAMAASSDFDGKFDTVPYEEFIETAEGPSRRLCNLMSAQWAYEKAVSAPPLSQLQYLNCQMKDRILQDPGTHGAMLVPIIGGADKTTVSVQTGNQEFHPAYMSLGNIHNDARRAHREGVLPIAFLAIPKGTPDFVYLRVHHLSGCHPLGERDTD